MRGCFFRAASFNIFIFKIIFFSKIKILKFKINKIIIIKKGKSMDLFEIKKQQEQNNVDIEEIRRHL